MFTADNGWTFNFGNGVAKRGVNSTYINGLSELRFRIKDKRVFTYNGRWWSRNFNVWTEQEVVEAYKHWQFERIVLR